MYGAPLVELLVMSVAEDGLSDLYEALERYKWDDDIEFQAGLQAIIGSNSTPEQTTELALRARCFYYARKYNKTIDFDAYKAYRSARNRPPPTPPSSTNVLASSVVDDVIPDPTSAATTIPASAPVSEPSGIMPTPTSPSEPPAPYPTSFAHIVELITSGKPVPGIKDIPPTVLEGQGTAASKPKRKKPWEKDEV
ncbi:hypothetical protein PTNB73_08498 [Pyrenophora teres f. teres]|nr:hypothetical protein HRS9139_08608 [Pyrenophora teres f. teres]KAE8834594.1 hypothetical protein PTNB85_05927 [Pyrenophora teres f. teres]KAE8843926.1 hypothetical protein HRS9122_05029 [Pyrenophora teres f. teres]KAE8859018.1 hypothetical protein PTNB73_08498 [Pyrenophora teres f. teres]KAE8860881.1 hypothetical protein PTNB29_05976 [Pyrenophora teres f. teres]